MQLDKIRKFNRIKYRKPFYPITPSLREHLKEYSRLANLPISYDDLRRYKDLIAIIDEKGEDTLWASAIYSESDLEVFHKDLINIYELLVADGDTVPYIRIENIDICSFGNSKPFRIKVVNEINDNHDYYYIKHVDASRVYGLELEDIFSPDKVSYLVNNETLIEYHIVGIPCDEFISKNKGRKIENRVRFAKEFVKFNERCFARLLGDMRAYNFVVEIIQDFDNVQYRLRAMDFDQQSFEGRRTIYLPQFYKDNLELVQLTQDCMTIETAEIYTHQERAAMKKRFLGAREQTQSLLTRMSQDSISTPENVELLKKELAKHHKNDNFLQLQNMGEILALHLETGLGILIYD